MGVANISIKKRTRNALPGYHEHANQLAVFIHHSNGSLPYNSQFPEIQESIC